MPRSINYDFLRGAADMPELLHADLTKPFDIMDSAVAEYIANLPEVRGKLFDMAKTKGYILYDPERGCWKGRNTALKE